MYPTKTNIILFSYFTGQFAWSLNNVIRKFVSTVDVNPFLAANSCFVADINS